MSREILTPGGVKHAPETGKPARRPGFKFHYWEYFKSEHGTFFRAGTPQYQGEVLENDFAKKLAAEIPLKHRAVGRCISIVEHVPSGHYAFAILHPRDQKALYGGRLFITNERKFREMGRRIAVGRLKKAHPELFEVDVNVG